MSKGKTQKVRIQKPPPNPKRKKPTMMQVDAALQQIASAIARLEIQAVAMYRAHAGTSPPMCKCGHPVGFHLDDTEGKSSTGQCIGYNHNEITGTYEPCNCERCDPNRIALLGGN